MQEFNRLNLQLFGDGAGAGAAATGAPAASGSPGDAAQDTGEKPVLYTKRGTPIYEKKPQVQPESQPPADTKQAEPQETPTEEKPETFESLIKGKYKAEYDANVQNIVQSRLKNSKGAEEHLGRLAPLLEALGGRYGVDASDIAKLDVDKLTQSVVSDRKYLEEEAEKIGVPIDQMQRIKALEFREQQVNRERQQSIQEQQRQQQFQRMVQQAEEAKKTYPGLDLMNEIKNPEFVRLTNAGVPVQTAYQVLHQNEIMSGMMQYTAQKTQEKVAKSIQAGAARPVENGVAPGPAATATVDITNKAFREDAKARARRGEKVTF